MHFPVARAFTLTTAFANRIEQQKVASLHRILSSFIADECKDHGEVGAASIELIDIGSGAMVERLGDDVIGEEELWTIAKSFLDQPEVKFTGEPVLLLIHSFTKS